MSETTKEVLIHVSIGLSIIIGTIAFTGSLSMLGYYLWRWNCYWHMYADPKHCIDIYMVQP